MIKSESNSSDVKISNFGTFMNKVTPERIGRNPKTGEEHVISERVKLNFIVSNKVKEQLN
jgi:nucleoid DNA-binding protein